MAREGARASLGALEPARPRPRRWGPARAVRGPPATPERPAAPVKHGQPNAASPGPRGQVRLSLVEGQGGGQRPNLLGRIGVAEHHLQAAARLREPAPDRREREHLVHHTRRLTQVIHRFEQRDDVEHRRLGAGTMLSEPLHRPDTPHLSPPPDTTTPPPTTPPP